MWKYLILFVFFAPASQAQEQKCEKNMIKTTPDSRFTVYSNKTVLDKKTNLMWKQCLQGEKNSSCGSVWTFTWKEALEIANTSNFAGYTDWRIPNIKELVSIVERSCFFPSINLSVFTGSFIDTAVSKGSWGSVWSSSPISEENTSFPTVWTLSFYFYGNHEIGYVDDSHYNKVILVRNGDANKN